MAKIMALTFDDGHSDTTPKILDILEEHGVVASFFLVGENISEETKPIIERQLALGCELCNHSYTHSDMTKLTAEEVRNEISSTSAKIKELSGVEPKFFRPPFILVNDIMEDNIDLPMICGIDSLDWNDQTPVEARVFKATDGNKNGAIILMHDFCHNSKTLEALPTIIKTMKKRGYEFVTVSELFKQKGVDPHVKGKLWSVVK